MSFPLPPGGLFPLTTAPTGRNAGGQYPLSAVLSDAIRSLAPTAYWKLDEASGNLADAMSGGYTATVTGSPTYGVAAPFGRSITWSGTGQYATPSTSVPFPTASISVLSLFRTTNASAADRTMMGRGNVASNHSWTLKLSTTHIPAFILFQGAASVHAQVDCGPSTATNTGDWMLVAATFDGTTVRGYRATSAGVLTPSSSTSLTASWKKDPTPAISIAAYNTGSLFNGTLGPQAYFADRVISDAEFRWLASLAFGG